jgi:hypothetical protein
MPGTTNIEARFSRLNEHEARSKAQRNCSPIVPRERLSAAAKIAKNSVFAGTF